MASYPGIQIPEQSPSLVPETDRPHIPDVLMAFQQIPTFGQANHVQLADTFGPDNQVYYGGLNNHFQGLARHRSGQYFILSGGDSLGSHSHLLIFKMKSYLQTAGLQPIHRTGPIRSNLISKDNRDKQDTIVELFFIDQEYWHAGGISLMGDILVVPLEKDDISKVVFIDVSDPMNPKRYSNFINRDIAGQKAGAASSIKLPNGHFLVAVWTEADPVGKRMDFYLSTSPKIDSVYTGPMTVGLDEFTNQTAASPRFQHIDFIQQSDGKVYMIGTDNRTLVGRRFNRCFLIHIEIHPDTVKPTPSLKKPVLTLFPVKNIQYGRRYYNFNAAGGSYIDSKKALILYSAAAIRRGYDGKRINFAEFYPLIQSTAPPVINSEFGTIELFTKTNFQERFMVIQVHREIELADYRKIKIVGSNPNDKIQSMRFKLPIGTTYRFFEDKHFNQGDPAKNHLTITGTGHLVEIPDLSISSTNGLKFTMPFDGKISSSKLV